MVCIREAKDLIFYGSNKSLSELMLSFKLRIMFKPGNAPSSTLFIVLSQFGLYFQNQQRPLQGWFTCPLLVSFSFEAKIPTVIERINFYQERGQVNILTESNFFFFVMMIDKTLNFVPWKISTQLCSWEYQPIMAPMPSCIKSTNVSLSYLS